MIVKWLTQHLASKICNLLLVVLLFFSCHIGLVRIAQRAMYICTVSFPLEKKFFCSHYFLQLNSTQLSILVQALLHPSSCLKPLLEVNALPLCFKSKFLTSD